MSGGFAARRRGEPGICRSRTRGAAYDNSPSVAPPVKDFVAALRARVALRSRIRRWLGSGPRGPVEPRPWTYQEDGLSSAHDSSFTSDPRFKRAYQRGVEAAAGHDYHWRWRVHIGLWAAAVASRLDGDFVECGVNRGFLASAILRDLEWDTLGKTFWLLDTFRGGEERLVSEAERGSGWYDRNTRSLTTGFYVTGPEAVRRNFEEWRNVRIIEGTVPHTLAEITAPRVAFLHLDMNCSAPEVAALEFFWESLVTGAIVLLDDYADLVFGESKRGMDALAIRKDVRIATLPTGQGLIVRPPH
jgi:Macrocin-O-methyltransferase (TylF)